MQTPQSPADAARRPPVPPCTTTVMYLPRRRTSAITAPTPTARNPRASTGRARCSPRPLVHTPVTARPRSTGARPRTIVSTSGSSGTGASRGPHLVQRVGQPREVSHRQHLGPQRRVDAGRGQRARDRLLTERRLQRAPQHLPPRRERLL